MKRVSAGLALALIGALALTAVGRVEKNEAGVLLRFGRVVRVLPPGMHAKLPWPADRIARVATTEVRTVGIGREAAGDATRPRTSQWITGDTNLVELELAVQYTVADPRAYLFAVDHDRTASADALVVSVAEAVVTGLIARRKIDALLATGKAELQLAARDAVQAGLDDLASGLRVAGVTITSAAPPHDVIAAFNDVTSAASDRESAIDRADGYRRDLLPTERARANRILKEAEQEEDTLVSAASGRAQAFLALVAELEHAPVGIRRRIWLERATALLGQVRTKVHPAGELFELTLIE